MLINEVTPKAKIGDVIIFRDSEEHVYQGVIISAENLGHDWLYHIDRGKGEEKDTRANSEIIHNFSTGESWNEDESDSFS